RTGRHGDVATGARTSAVARGLDCRGEGMMTLAITCDEASGLLHALIDGELDASHVREIEAHAATCARCAAELAAMRELQQALRGHALSYTAPASLRGSVDRAVPMPV